MGPFHALIIGMALKQAQTCWSEMLLSIVDFYDKGHSLALSLVMKHCHHEAYFRRVI